MLLLRAFLLWSLVSLHVVAGAVLFRRLFGREATWFGIIVPAIGFCLVLNFIEYGIPLTWLPWLLPFTTLGSLLLLLRPGYSWDGMRFPIGIFLGSFAFTFFIRCLEPDVLASSDGLADLNLIANFCRGETLPPTDGWMPPYKLEYYHTFHHYAASILTRLLRVDIGTGYNLSHALVSAFTCYVAAACAWRITGKMWIPIAMVFIIESSATGSSAYLWLTEHDHDPSPWTMADLSGGIQPAMENNDHNPIWALLATAPYRESLRLQPPGYWTWRDEYHPNASGHLLTLFAVWIVLELMRRGRFNWPWILAFMIPVISITASIWAFPITGLLCGGGLILALVCQRRPENISLVILAAAAGLVLVWPSIISVFSAPNSPPVIWTPKEFRTPFFEFVIQWWPVWLPWFSLLFIWRKLPLEVCWILVVVPLILIGIETVNIEEGRYNTIEKMWGYTYGIGLVVFFSAVAMRRAYIYCVVTALLLFSSVVAFSGWMYTTFHWVDMKNVAWHLKGNGVLARDPQRARLLQVVSQLHDATLFTGKVDWAYYESPALAVFTGNNTYIAWTYSEEHYGHLGENDFRKDEVNNFYDGKVADPLDFLIARNIAAVVIWPEDKISDDFIAKMKEQLAPYYDYIDCRLGGDNNAGVFLSRPNLIAERVAAKP